MKIVLSKSGLSRGLAFVTAPDQVCTELIKSNGIDFKSHRLTIEEALVNPKVKESSPSKIRQLKLKTTRHLLKKFQWFPVKKVIQKQQGRIIAFSIP